MPLTTREIRNQFTGVTGGTLNAQLVGSARGFTVPGAGQVQAGQIYRTTLDSTGNIPTGATGLTLPINDQTGVQPPGTAWHLWSNDLKGTGGTKGTYDNVIQLLAADPDPVWLDSKSSALPSVSYSAYVAIGSTAGGDLSGTYPNPVVDGLQGRAVAATAPTDGQSLVWDTPTATWGPETITGGGGGGMTNPMTTAEDIIYGGAAGTPLRRGIGAVGRVLGVGTGPILAWLDDFGINVTDHSTSVVRDLYNTLLNYWTAINARLLKTQDGYNFSVNSNRVIDIPSHCTQTITTSAALTSGTATVAYSKALAITPTVFASGQVMPLALARGDILRITITGYAGTAFAMTFERTA